MTYADDHAANPCNRCQSPPGVRCEHDEPTPTPAPGLDLDAVELAVLDLEHAAEVRSGVVRASNVLRDRIAALIAEVRALRAQVCRLVSGQAIESDALCQHHDADLAALAERDEARAEIARLTAELAAARAVSGDVEAAIEAMRSAATWDDPSGFDKAEIALRTAIARAISDATAARGTVGGQTGPVGKLLGSHAIVEWYAAPDWYQARIAQHRTGTVKGAELRWRHENARGWSSWGQPWGRPGRHMDQPARLVPAAEADTDPSQRGPLPKGG